MALYMGNSFLFHPIYNWFLGPIFLGLVSSHEKPLGKLRSLEQKGLRCCFREASSHGIPGFWQRQQWLKKDRLVAGRECPYPWRNHSRRSPKLGGWRLPTSLDVDDVEKKAGEINQQTRFSRCPPVFLALRKSLKDLVTPLEKLYIPDTVSRTFPYFYIRIQDLYIFNQGISTLLFSSFLQESYNTPLEHTPGNPPKQLWTESLYSQLVKV